MTIILALLLAGTVIVVIKLASELSGERQKRQRITSQIAASDQEAHVARARLLASINSLKLGFIMTDQNGSILLINTAAINLLCNVELDHVKVVASAAPSLDFHCTIEEITEELHQNFDLKTEIKNCLKTKKQTEFADVAFQSFYLYVRLSPIIVDGQAIGVVVLVEDITDAKNLERSKDEFFSIASHELRTPLTAIRGNADLLRQFHPQLVKNKDVREMIDDIESSSDRLIGIVNDYLNVSRLEQKRISFSLETFNLFDLAAKVTKDLQITAKQKKLTLELRPVVDREAVVVKADKNRVEEVLINLISNALKYTDVGSVTVEIQTTLSTVRVLITDTGRGIAKESQSQLFKKFSQAKSNIYTRDPAKSTGLGLYISKLLIAGMGGMIQLEKSLPGQGSTFSFVLPRANVLPTSQPLKTVPKVATVRKG